MRKIKLKTWIIVILVAIPALWIAYSAGWILVWPALNSDITKTKVINVGYTAILQGCREMTRNYTSYTNDADFADLHYIAFSGSTAQNIPSSIRSLKPQYIRVYTNRVEIQLRGPPRLFLCGYNDNGYPGDQWQQITNGLWWYGTAKF